MKKIILIMLTAFLTLTLFSCSESDDFLTEPQEVSNTNKMQSLCCGEEGELPPPPPPPPADPDGN